MKERIDDDDGLRDFSTVFTNEKAGMQNVDKEKVKRVVYGMSKDSAHHQNEVRKQAKVTERVASMKSVQQQLSSAALLNRERELQPLLAQLEARRDLSQVWLHVDMDAFYAACEERDNPELRTVPVAIGSMSMISTANYEARKYGVRAAMPGFIAIKLCPHLKFIKSDFQKYEEAAAQAREVFSKFDVSYCSRGLDEASLCITQYCATTGFSAAKVAEQIRTQVHAKTGLTCSCGTAPNALLAKICSDLRKPNGQFHVGSTREDVMAFMDSLSVRKVPGIGRVSERLLAEFGVHVVSDLYRHRGLLSYLFSSTSMDFFMHVALGLASTQRSETDMSHPEGRKSVSHEKTFTASDCEEDLKNKVSELATKVSQDLQDEGFCGKCVTLKLKQTDFRVRQRSTTLPTCINSAESISTAATKLLSHELPIKVRLIGVKVSSLQSSSSMTSLELFLRRAQNSEQLTAGDKLSGLSRNVCHLNASSEYAVGNAVHDGVVNTVRTSVPIDDAHHIERVGPALDVAPAESGFCHHLCNECGVPVPIRDLQEHKDMHVAIALSRQMNGPSYLSTRSPANCGADEVITRNKRKPGCPLSDQATPITATGKQGKNASARGVVKMGRIDLLLSTKTGKG